MFQLPETSHRETPSTSQTPEMPSRPAKPPRNGGYGWIVVMGAAWTNIFNQSLVSLYGLLFGETIGNLGSGTNGVALVMNMESLCLNFSGIIIGPLLKTFGPRSVTILGSICAGTGLILSRFSTQLWHFLFSYSLLVGFGLGVIAPSCFMAMSQYFTTRKGTANGISMAGTGLGQMVMPYLVSFLLESYGFPVAVTVMGTLALNGVVGGSLFKPNPEQEYERIREDDEGGRSRRRKRRGCCGSFWRELANKLDLKLLKRPGFMILTTGLALAYTASINFSMIYPFYLQNEINMTKSETALSMSLLAGADLTSRLILPVLTDQLHASSRLVFLVGILLLICVRTVLATFREKLTIMLVSVVYGFVRASTIVNQNLAVSEYCHQYPELLPSALGINMTIKGVFVITIGQLLGWLRDYFDSYSAALYAQNCVLIVVPIFWIPEFFYKKMIEKRRTGYQELCCEPLR